uniref:C2H2-type domain-containing protein n=1 Tax=Scophthalmus maximus TaxID=52904 RepID=A0A8D3AS55_SCOMX
MIQTVDCPCNFLVEEYACRWQVPLPQLGILELALRYFARASTFFPPNCDHVLHTLSSLECHLVLVRHQNVHLLQVERLVQGDGPWSSLVLQAILSDSNLPPNEVDGCISSELPVFLELRVRYLLSCKRVGEAMALAKCCARHPTAGQHLFFHQVYLKWLYKSSQHDCLHKEVAHLSTIHIICSLECDEKDDLLLALSRAFLSQQLRRGDMYYLCDLVFVWSKLHSRLNTSKQALLEESHQLMRSATNVNSIFPFIRAILKELGEDGKQFCVELCAKALETCLPCDVVTKSLIYKTIAGLLPNDLEVCRACALLVFFLERTVDAYKIVYLLYMHPDQEYHVEHSPIANHVRFEMLQVLKKDLYFDPEFWNLIALRTNCLKLMSERGVRLRSLKDASSEPLRRSFWQLDKKPDGVTIRCGEHRRMTRLSEKNPPKRRIRKPKWLLEDSGTPEDNNVPTKIKKQELTHQKHHRSCVVKRSETGQIKNSAKHKKIKESAGDKVQENRVSETKGISIPLTSAKDKTTNMSSARRGRGRPRKTAEFPESVSLQDVRPSESRKLRSKEKTVDGNVIQEKKQNTSKHRNSETRVHKVNGHVCKKKTDKPQDRVRCPVGGCVWFKDLSKNRVALLYHALDDHYGEPKPLELAFRVGKSRCAICMRVLWSFEHFQHHVERHRLAPRHPCLHQGCKARFKTGMEMRRHARRHSPLQAVCCLPGCSQLFICLWALNLHEREHYASRPTKPDRIASEETGDKHDHDGKKQLDHDPKDTVAGNKTVSLKASHVKSTETSVDESKLKDLVDKQIEKSHVKHKGGSHNTSTAVVTSNSLNQTIGTTSADKAQKLTAGYYLMNGQASVQDVISTVTKDALAMYGKRPYMRIPPTAYLDEKYITMPKRRKEMSLFQSPMHTPPPGPARTAAVLQRQRCANCFATFNSAEDLQCHLQLQKCSNLFGFDSDDEGDACSGNFRAVSSGDDC